MGGAAVGIGRAWILMMPLLFASALLLGSVDANVLDDIARYNWPSVIPPETPEDPYGWDLKKKSWVPPGWPDPNEFLYTQRELVVNPPMRLKQSCFDDYPIIAGCPAKCRNMCYYVCIIDRVVCPCIYAGNVCDDPRFVGGDGNTFLFHGRKDADFCLLSDANLHINAHFIGKRNTNASRDFTWVQGLGIRFDNHLLYLGVKKTTTWDSSIDRLEMSFNGEPVYLETEPNAKWLSSSTRPLSITRTSSTNGVAVQLDGKFKIIANAVPVTKKDSKIHNYGLTANDSLAHLNVAFTFYSLSVDVHGVLGQTYRPDYVAIGVDNGAKIPVMGGRRKYSSSNIFTTDCAVARFTGEEHSVDMLTEPKNVRCASRKSGAGLVCKK